MKAWILLVVSIFIINSESRLEPTKFQDGKIYALENQHSGKYLTVGKIGEYIRTGDRGTPTIDQQWKFIRGKDSKSGRDGWQLVPLNGNPSQPTIWKEIYVGHGKFQFQSISSGLCLEASNRGIEITCNREDLNLKWFPHPIQTN